MSSPAPATASHRAKLRARLHELQRQMAALQDRIREKEPRVLDVPAEYLICWLQDTRGKREWLASSDACGGDPGQQPVSFLNDVPPPWFVPGRDDAVKAMHCETLDVAQAAEVLAASDSPSEVGQHPRAWTLFSLRRALAVVERRAQNVVAKLNE